MTERDFNGWRRDDMKAVGLTPDVTAPYYLNFLDIKSPLWDNVARYVVANGTFQWLIDFAIGGRIVRDTDVYGIHRAIDRFHLKWVERKILMIPKIGFLGVGSVKLYDTVHANLALRNRQIQKAYVEALEAGFCNNYAYRYAACSVYRMSPKKQVTLPQDNPYHTIVSLMFPYHSHKEMYEEYDIKTMHMAAVSKYRLMLL